MSIFHRRTKVAVPPKPGETPVTCQKCGYKYGITITAGRAKGGTFAICQKCGSGGVYDEYGQAYSPTQYAAEQLIRKYGQR